MNIKFISSIIFPSGPFPLLVRDDQGSSQKSKKIIKDGFLTKQGNIVENWKLRFFELYNDRIFYYKCLADRGKSPKGVIYLIDKNGVVALLNSDVPSMKNQFNLFSIGIPGKRTFLISAETLEIKQEWTKAISEVLEDLKQISSFLSRNECTLDADEKRKPVDENLVVPVKNQDESLPMKKALEEQQEKAAENERLEELKRIQERKEFDEKSAATLVFQNLIKAMDARNLFEKRKDRMIRLQALAKGFIARMQYTVLHRGICCLQSKWRGVLSRRKYEAMQKRSNQRRNVAKELLLTEQSYVSSLTILNELFVDRLSKSPTPISAKDVSLIFSNCKEILGLHTLLLASIQQRLEAWTPHQKLGDLFLNTMEELRSSYSIYIINFDKSMETLRELLENNAEFVKFIQEMKNNQRCNLLELSDFLIMPIQRLPRYELLLANYLKYTDPDTPDFAPVNQALQKLKWTTNNINDQKREHDSKERIMHLEQRVRGKDKPKLLVQPGRALIREGMLTVIRQKDGSFFHITNSSTSNMNNDSTHMSGNWIEKKIYCFLFTDMILISKPVPGRKHILDQTMRYDFKKSILLTNVVQVEDLGSLVTGYTSLTNITEPLTTEAPATSMSFIDQTDTSQSKPPALSPSKSKVKPPPKPINLLGRFVQLSKFYEMELCLKLVVLATPSSKSKKVNLKVDLPLCSDEAIVSQSSSSDSNVASSDTVSSLNTETDNDNRSNGRNHPLKVYIWKLETVNEKRSWLNSLNSAMTAFSSRSNLVTCVP